MPYPELKDWQQTSRALHQASMLAVPVQRALLQKRNNWLHLAMDITPEGIASQTLPQGGKISVSYKDAALSYQQPTGNISRFALADHTQASLFDALLNAVKDDELSAFFTGNANDPIDEIFKKFERDGETLFLNVDDLTHTESLTVNPETAAAYADVLYGMYTAVARFKARLVGHMTPAVIWGEHFDLSTLWFVDPAMDDHKAHMNFGFAPFSDGFDLPYLYVYAYPYPENFDPPAVPAPARWHTTGWTGVVIDYQDIAAQAQPEQFVEAMCLQIFEILRGIL